MTRFGLVSHVLPPSSSGQSMVLYRLLKDLSPSQYCLIRSGQAGASLDGPGFTPRLAAKHFQIHPVRWPSDTSARVRTWSAVGRGVSRLLGLMAPHIESLDMGRRVRQISRILEHEGCGAVVACTGDLLDMPSAFLASRRVGLPFYAYYFDYYSQQWVDPIARFVAERLEGHLLRGARGIIVPNEFLGTELNRRYGVEPTIIRNPCELAAEKPHLAEVPEVGSQIRIVYVGTVYSAQLDAMVNLVSALRLAGKGDFRLHLYTATSRQKLQEMGIMDPVQVHDHSPASEVSAIYRSAHILFLPLAFNSRYRSVIVKTSAPAKMGEYLASGCPILVHAPPRCFVSRYFRDHQCGLVIDRKDPTLLSEAVFRLASDSALRKALTDAAWERARTDFDATRSRHRFTALMGISHSGSVAGT